MTGRYEDGESVVSEEQKYEPLKAEPRGIGTKGQQDEQTDAKRRALELWVKAVNQHGGFGKWSSKMATTPGQIKGILHRYVHATNG